MKSKTWSYAVGDAMNSRAKHSPAPWHISQFEVKAGGTGRVIMGADDYTVASVTERSTKENDINARLIAAAPDLLDIAKRFVAYHDCVAVDDSAGESHKCLCQVCLDARRVIQKAEGK